MHVAVKPPYTRAEALCSTCSAQDQLSEARQQPDTIATGIRHYCIRGNGGLSRAPFLSGTERSRRAPQK